MINFGSQVIKDKATGARC